MNLSNYEKLKVKLYQVKAEDFPAFQKLKVDESEMPAFGTLVYDKSIDIKSEQDERTETRIDIRSALTKSLGHAVLIVEPPVITKDNEDQRVIVWLEATQIGVDAFADYEKLIVFTTDLKNGKPLSNVKISLLNGVKLMTGTNGVAELILPAAKVKDEENKQDGLLIAERGRDSAILFEDNYRGGESKWVRQPSNESLRWFVFNDRNLYRMGETVSVKGYLRRIKSGKFADVAEIGGAVKSVSYVLKDSRDNEILKGKADINAFGAFDLKLKLPENLNLGNQQLEFKAETALDEKEFTHTFQVQEFRRPEFEVETEVKNAAPFFVGDAAIVGTQAKYYSGGFLPNAAAKWKVTAKPTSYTPPNREDFTFGKFVPWWRDEYDGEYSQTVSQEFKGTTDANGSHRIAIDFVAANPARPYALTAEASVEDVNRQTFTSTATLLVHPSALYVGLKTAKTFVRSGERFKVETITTDIDGKAVAEAPVIVVAELKDWQQVKGEWQEVTVDTQPCQAKSAAEIVACEFTAKQGGKLTISGSVADSRGRRNESELTVWSAGGKLADAAEIELPVYTPATTETFATYGTTDANGAIFQPIETPKGVFPQFGGLEITTSSTQLPELTDAFLYLQNYPYECSEQISSRVLSVAALRDVLAAFDAKDLPSKAEIEAKMKSDIERLAKLQHADGGFSFWRIDDESLPFLSVHVAHAFTRAQLKGYAVSPEILAKSRSYLQNVESKFPASYSVETRRAISAYALYTLDLSGEKDAAKAKQILRDQDAAATETGKFTPEIYGWLLSVLANDANSTAEVAQIKRRLLNRVTETAGAANFVTDYADEGRQVLLASDRRADSVILESLLKAEPQNELIPKLVRGLLAHKVKGRWSNTQENIFVLLALDKYFESYEKVTPNFVAKIWLGVAFAGEQNFKNRTTDSNSVKVPMSYLQQQANSQNLILDREGAGRLYYRIGLNYAPADLNQAAADYGFAVTRTYEAVDEANDVRQNADGSWTIKSGARVRVTLQMVASARRYHVALVDRLPAGFEIINSAFANSQTVPDETPAINYADRFQQKWFEYQNLRDDRAEAFASFLGAGVWSYSYVARASTPGNFIAPPAKAEEMYAPETFGRTATDFVKVE
ncbi:MAG: MG2 domain-containing protein [Pyrinomonadaceae bacterium]